MKKLILFLVRKHLGLRKWETFQFANQKDKRDYYYFADDALRKMCYAKGLPEDSHVSLNWLLDDKCEVVKFDPCTLPDED